MRLLIAALWVVCAVLPAAAQPTAPLPSVAPGHARFPFPPNAILYSDALNEALGGKADARSFLQDSATWTVCAVGCTYSTMAAVWTKLDATLAIAPTASIDIVLSRGVFEQGFALSTVKDLSNVHIRGDCTTPGGTVLRFTNIVGNNGSGFRTESGGKIGRLDAPGVDCLTIQGVGARIGRSEWADQSYGAGAFALGTGSTIHFGPKVVVDGFYYSVLADQGGRFVGNRSTYKNAGDSNLLARFGGVIECQFCTLATASHVFNNAYGALEALGHNALAEGSASLYVDGSTATDAQIACFASHTGATVWAHAVSGIRCIVYGASADQGGVMEIGHSKFAQNGTGVHAGSGGILNIDFVESNNNTYDGMLLDGGRAVGSGFNGHNNGGVGVKVLKQGKGELYATMPLLLNNTGGPFYVEPENGCLASFQVCNPASTLIMDGAPVPGWIVFTPAVASTSPGLVATASMHGNRKNVSRFEFSAVISVATVGGSGSISVVMPYSSVIACAVVGYETGANGKAVIGKWVGASMFISTSDNLYPVVAGTTSLTLTGACEINYAP